MMKIIEYSLKNTLVIYIIASVIIILGIFCWFLLPVNALPYIKPDKIMIETLVDGANPIFMESAVTVPIESALGDIEGISSIRSFSSLGESHLHVTFKKGFDYNQVIYQIQNQLSFIKNNLPNNATTPEIIKMDNSNSNSLLFLGVYAINQPMISVYELAKNQIAGQIKNIPGIAQVKLIGYRQPAVRIWVKLEALARYHLSINEVARILEEKNAFISGGRVEDSHQAITMNVLSKPESLEQLAETAILTLKDGPAIKLGDIAAINVEPQNQDDMAMVNGHPGVILQILPQNNVNSLAVAARLNIELDKLESHLPEGYKLVKILDMSKNIKILFSKVNEIIIEAIILVAVVIFLFLGSLRLLIIPVIAIPVCIICGFIIIYLMNFSINLMTLLAIALSIGLVVDDAIVVLDNIHRHTIQTNKIANFIMGIAEIIPSIIAMTLTLVVVYIPILFVQGFIGQLIKPYAYTLASLVLISGIFSLLLTPCMCLSILTLRDRNDQNINKLELLFRKISVIYEISLRRLLKKQFLIILVIILIGGAGLITLQNMKSQIFPSQDYGGVVAEVIPQENDSPYQVRGYLQKMQNIFATVPEAANYFGVTNFKDTGINFYLGLKPLSQRKYSAEQVAQRLSDQYSKTLGAMTFFDTAAILNAATSDKSISMVLSVNSGPNELETLTAKLVSAFKDYPGINQVNSDLSYSNKQIQIEIKQPLADQLGVSSADIAANISTLYGGLQLTNKFFYKNTEYPIILQMPGNKALDLTHLDEIQVKSRTSGKDLPITMFLNVRQIAAPLGITHYDGLLSARIQGELAPNYSMAKVLVDLDKIGQNIISSGQGQLTWIESSRQFLESSSNMIFIILLSLTFIYLVLALQFKNFIDPIVILITVPLSFLGAIIMLKCGGGSLNIYTKMGLLTLIGLVTKHGILIVDFANRLVMQGHDRFEAIIVAAKIRLRPVLMTVLAMIFGSIPLIFVRGEGCQALAQIGLVIVGGLSFGTFFSLYIIPWVYLYAKKLRMGLSSNPQDKAECNAIIVN